jgi:hypothetical protein
MKDRVIVSFANERGNYMQALKRLWDSTVSYAESDFLPLVGESTIGAPKHGENPYAFKIYGIEKALSLGYRKILWLDSSCYLIRSAAPIWEEIEEHGYIAQYAGCHVSTWTNDKALSYFGITREEADSMEMYGNAGFLGLNFDNPIASEFFEQWKQSMLNGLFKGNWNNNDNTESNDLSCRGHRHDMSCGSIVANKLGMNKRYKRGDEWLEYAPPETDPKNDTIIIKAQGL